MRSFLLLFALLASPCWPAGIASQAYSNDQMTTTSPAASLPSDSTFTMVIWAYYPNTSYQIDMAALCARFGTGSSGVRAIYPYDTRNSNTATTCVGGGCGARTYMGTGFHDIDENGATRTGWHHFLMVSRSSTDKELYVDGVSVGTSSASTSLPATITALHIGARNTTEQFYIGSLAHAAWYDRALTAVEIQELATGSLYSTVPTPVHSWPTWDTGTSFNDYGSAGSDMTCSGGACPATSADGPQVFIAGGVL